jgi:hypothetical protein
MPGGGHSPEYDFDETKPGGSTYIADGDNWNVSNQQHFDNALSVEHYSPSNDPDASEDDFGRHDYITLKEQASKPTLTGSTTRHGLYAKSIGIFIEEDDGTEYQILSFSTGRSAIDADIPSGKIILFYSDTEIAGYTLITSRNDVLVYIGSGSAAGGLTGGAIYPDSTWTQPNHTHTYSATTGTPSGTAQDQGDGTDVCAQSTHTHTVSGTTGNGATANTWRPLGYVVTLQQRN